MKIREREKERAKKKKLIMLSLFGIAEELRTWYVASTRAPRPFFIIFIIFLFIKTVKNQK